MFYPSTMMEALGLAKLAEDKIIAQQRSQSTFVPFRNMVSQIPPIMLAPRIAPIKHLSEFKMQERREKGLCYNHDDKFTWGHRCAKQKLYLFNVASSHAPEICGNAQDPVDDQVKIQQPPIDPPSQDE